MSGRSSRSGRGSSETCLSAIETALSHVVRLEVAVDHSAPVREPGGLQDLLGEVDRARLRQRRVLADQLLERPPVEVLHRDVVGPVVLAAVEDADDVRVLQPGRGGGLPPEALDELAVAREAAVEHLERDVAAELAVLGAVDVGHPAGADPVLDQVAAVYDRAVRDVSHCFRAVAG